MSIEKGSFSDYIQNKIFDAIYGRYGDRTMYLFTQEKSMKPSLNDQFLDLQERLMREKHEWAADRVDEIREQVQRVQLVRSRSPKCSPSS